MHSRKRIKRAAVEPIHPGPARDTAAPKTAVKAALRIDQRTGLPLIRSPRPVTAEDVRALQDD
jgi:hypothetical protein